MRSMSGVTSAMCGASYSKVKQCHKDRKVQHPERPPPSLNSPDEAVGSFASHPTTFFSMASSSRATPDKTEACKEFGGHRRRAAA